MGATEWYYNNFTAQGLPFMMGSVEVLNVWLDGKIKIIIIDIYVYMVYLGVNKENNK